jgi:hypothetical protein
MRVVAAVVVAVAVTAVEAKVAVVVAAAVAEHHSSNLIAEDPLVAPKLRDTGRKLGSAKGQQDITSVDPSKDSVSCLHRLWSQLLCHCLDFHFKTESQLSRRWW